jgi:alpha-glucosidase
MVDRAPAPTSSEDGRRLTSVPGWAIASVAVVTEVFSHHGLTSPGAESSNGEIPWWKGAVFYQIYPRSFADSNGDGIGDLAGIRAHLDHLVWLGVDALWISPFFPSPMIDFGYDVSDYCDVDSLFGTLEDFDGLLAHAHALGLKVIIDWVPNHTSDRHPWFVDAISGTTSEHRSWYVWRDQLPDGRPPNNWVAAFDPSSPAWTLEPLSGQWYLHLFESAQPDLNWDEPAVVAAMHDVLRFWIGRGVDGFRADVIHCIGKDPLLPDDPPTLAGIPHCGLNDVPVTHQRIRQIRSVIGAPPGERVLVGEVYLLSTATIATYYGQGDELDLAFNFPPLYAPWNEQAWSRCIETTEGSFEPTGAWPTWVLSNHDNPRHRTRYDAAAIHDSDEPSASEARARAAAVLLLTLRGTPFLYQGEELGLTDALITPDRRVDPGGRDGCRAPIPWDAGEDRGWPSDSGGEPWLPFPPDAEHRSVGVQRGDPQSILHLYRRMLVLRHGSDALSVGGYLALDFGPGLLAFRRFRGTETKVVVINFKPEPTGADGPAAAACRGWRIALASDGVGEARPFRGTVGPYQALVLEQE